MCKISLFLLIFAFFNLCGDFLSCGVTDRVFAEEVGGEESVEEKLKDSTEDILNDIDFSEIEQMVSEIDIDFELFDGLGFKAFVNKIIKGEETIDIETLFSLLKKGVLKSLKNILLPLLTILTIVLICNMFNNVRSGKISGVGEIIYFVCFSIVIIIVSGMAANVITDAKDGLSKLQSQMNSIFPILLTLMGLMGGNVSVKAYSPMFAFLSNSISNIFIYVLLPLFSVSLILSIVGNLSENTKLGKLNGFISSLFKWIIGVVFALYMGFMSLKGITAGASDGISIKATKYAIKNYIPMLGGYISDGFELLKAGGLLVKNATGFASIILLLATIVTPIISIAVLQLGLKLLAGVVEPLGDNRSSTLLYSIAKSLKLLVVVLVGVALMFFLTIYLVTCSVSNFI